ncbi:BACON domain-containing protein, partial [Escherichia coli]
MLRIIKRMTLPALALLLCGCIRPGNDEVLVTPYTKIDFPADGQAREFSISSNFLWTIEISDTWITINPMKGYGDKNMMVTALPNTSLDARQSSFFIVGEQIRREITVTQKGEVPGLALDNTQRTVKAAGDTVSVGVTTNVELNVVPEQDWVSYKETKTVTTKRYIFTVQQNTSLEGRSCRIQFTQKNGSLSAVFTILQDGESPAIELETNTITAVAQGGQYKVTVLSNIEWEAATETSWIHLTGTRLMQPQDCVFMVDANPRVETRQGTLVISTPGHP